jgi:hypothetical protein
MAYLNKSEAFAFISSRYPRGADVGTKVYYHGDSTQRRVEFTVAAEQVWRTDTGERVMGLIWSGVCATCQEGFFQPSPTHPKELNEHCSFCCSQRYDTYNEADIKMFDPRKVAGVGGRAAVKRRGRMENHVLAICSLFVDMAVVDAGTLVDRAVEALPPPEAGKRDIRRHSIVRAIQSLSREKDGPLKLEGGKIFLFE